jgi:hypothetical protein
LQALSRSYNRNRERDTELCAWYYPAILRVVIIIVHEISSFIQKKRLNRPGDAGRGVCPEKRDVCEVVAP